MWLFSVISVVKSIGAVRDGSNTPGKSTKNPSLCRPTMARKGLRLARDILKESMAAYGIALQEERAGLVTAPSLPATDYDLEPEHTMDYQTEETEEDPDIQVVGSE